MRTLIILLFTKNIAYVLSMAGLGAFKPCSAQHENSLGKGIYFEENKGQVLTPAGEERYDILFFGKSESMSFYVKSDGLSLQMYHREVSLQEQLPDEPAAEELPPVHTLVERVDIEWVGAQQPEVKQEDKVGFTKRYYCHPSHFPGGVQASSFRGVRLTSVWPGVDAWLHGEKGYLECDWYVDNPLDVERIRFRYHGASVRIEGDELVVQTQNSEIREGALRVYQNGRQLSGRWLIHGQEVSIGIEGWDPHQPLWIDPPFRQWGTYFGGGSNEFDPASDVTMSGEICVSGTTASDAQIATIGSHQQSFAGVQDVFLAKFDSIGVLLWATYYGSMDSFDVGFDVSVDASGYIYTVGSTQAATGMATTGAFQEAYGGATDGFLAKWSPDGELLWSSYIGGEETDQARGCAADLTGNVYVVGNSESLQQIATENVHQPSPGSNGDVFLMKFTSEGEREWGTYYGGFESEIASDCTADSIGNVYITGFTRSAQGIASVEAFQATRGLGRDAFLAKFNAFGNRLWGTYYGGNGDDYGYSCDTDPQGGVYIGGSIGSGDGIASEGSHQSNLAGAGDGFVARFTADGDRRWGTYYGGPDADHVEAIAASSDGNVYFGGRADSQVGISTADGFQSTSDGTNEGFFAKMDSTGTLVWASYYGGSSSDFVISLNVQGTNTVWITGTTSSSSNIATAGAHQETTAGNNDIFIAKFNNEGTSSNMIGYPEQPLLVYPNPSSDLLQVVLPGHGMAEYRLFDNKGAECKNGRLFQSHSVIALPETSGLYMLHVTQGDARFCVRVMRN